MKFGEEVIFTAKYQKQKLEHIDLEEIIDDVEQEWYALKEIKETKGIVVGRRNLPTKLTFSSEYDDEYAGNFLGITKHDFVECYKIAYGLNKSCLVPKSEIIVLKEQL